MSHFFSKIPKDDRVKIIISIAFFAALVIAALYVTIVMGTSSDKADVIPNNPRVDKVEKKKEAVAENKTSAILKKKVVSKPAVKLPGERFMKGFAYAGYGRDVFASRASDASVRRLAKTGTNWISIVPIWYQQNWRSTKIAPASYSPTDASLIHLIDLARKYKMNVLMRPFVDSVDGSWRAQYEPMNVNLWFANYRKFIIHYAKIAQKKNVPILCIGTELTSSEKYAKQWRATIRDIRKVYKGKLTYGADYHDIHGKRGNLLDGGYLKVKFWKDLDYIGVDAYFPLTKKRNPTVRELEAAWRRWSSQMASVSRKYNKKIVITELMYMSADGANTNPGAYKYKRVLDLREQAYCYEATLKVLLKQKWLAALFWWRWDNPSTSDWGGGPRNDGPTPKGKPAEKVLTKWFHRIR